MEYFTYRDGAGGRELFAEDVVQRAGLRIRRLLHRKRAGTGEETRRALGVDISTGLKGTVQSSNQRHLILYLRQRLQRGRELERMNAYGNARTIAKRLSI